MRDKAEVMDASRDPIQCDKELDGGGGGDYTFVN